MMNTKTIVKKFSSIFLALSMLFTFLPVMSQSAYAAEDTSPPAVDFSSLKVTLPDGKDSISPGETVHFSIKVTDDSPFDYRNCAAIYRVPGVTSLKRVYMEREDYNEETGLWECDISIDDVKHLPGLYQLSGIIFGDSKGNIIDVWNSACYSDDRPLVDLSAGDFRISAGCADHKWVEKIQKATPTEDGRYYQQCSVCGTEEMIAPLLKVSNIRLAGTSYPYTGKAITPKVTVGNASETLSTNNYKVSYSNNTKVGTATAKITLTGDYYEGTKSLTFKITKAPQTVTVPKTAYTKTYGNSAFSLGAKTNGDGALKYATGNSKVAAVNPSGKVSIKGAGTAKITVYATAGTYYNQSAKKTVTITVKQAANPLKIKALTATVKYSAVKKKTQTLAVSKVIAFTTKGQGKLTYSKVSGNQQIAIDKTTGKVTVKKGLKKGTYQVKAKVKAAGNANFKASAWKTVTFTVRVK